MNVLETLTKAVENEIRRLGKEVGLFEAIQYQPSYDRCSSDTYLLGLYKDEDTAVQESTRYLIGLKKGGDVITLKNDEGTRVVHVNSCRHVSSTNKLDEYILVRRMVSSEIRVWARTS